jgi:hypothetical protein
MRIIGESVDSILESFVDSKIPSKLMFNIAMSLVGTILVSDKELHKDAILVLEKFTFDMRHHDHDSFKEGSRVVSYEGGGNEL